MHLAFLHCRLPMSLRKFLLILTILLLFMSDFSFGQELGESNDGGFTTINCQNCPNCQYPCPQPPPPPQDPSPPPPPPPAPVNCPPVPPQCCQNSSPQMPYNYIPPPPQNPYAYLPYNNFSASVPLNSRIHYPLVIPLTALLPFLL